MPSQFAFICNAVLSLCVLNVACPVHGQEDDVAAPAPSQANLYVVQAGELALKVEREGRIDSADKIKVRIIPHEYKGSFEVLEVARRSGRVSKGDVLLRLNAEPFDKEIESSQVALDHAQRRLQIALEEQRIMREANATRLEQVQKNRKNVETESMIWEKYDSPGMLRSAELTLQQREFGLADQKQELDQLEQMYSGTHLATETKDIVLERARRGVKMSEAWLVLSKNSELVTREYRHAIQDRNVRDALKLAQQEEAHAQVNIAAAEERKSMEVESSQRAVRDAEEKLAKLSKDRELFVVTAPADGIMTRLEHEPRDLLSARSTICEVLNPTKLLVKFSLTAEDLRVIENGSSAALPSITLRLVEFPDIALTGKIEEIAEIGVAADKATNFPVTVAITTSDPRVRVGMRCKLFASRTLPDAITLPSNAVTWENGEAWCTVQTDEGAQKRRIVVGATVDDKVAVVEGLSAGDQIVLKEAGK